MGTNQSGSVRMRSGFALAGAWYGQKSGFPARNKLCRTAAHTRPGTRSRGALIGLHVDAAHILKTRRTHWVFKYPDLRVSDTSHRHRMPSEGKAVQDLKQGVAVIFQDQKSWAGCDSNASTPSQAAGPWCRMHGPCQAPNSHAPTTHDTQLDSQTLGTLQS